MQKGANLKMQGYLVDRSCWWDYARGVPECKRLVWMQKLEAALLKPIPSCSRAKDAHKNTKTQKHKTKTQNQNTKTKQKTKKLEAALLKPIPSCTRAKVGHQGGRLLYLHRGDPKNNDFTV